MKETVKWDAQPPYELSSLSFFNSQQFKMNQSLQFDLKDEPYVYDKPKADSSVDSTHPILLPWPAILLKLRLLTAFPKSFTGPPSR